MSQVQQWINDLALLPDLTPTLQIWQPFLHNCTASTLSLEQLPEALSKLGGVKNVAVICLLPHMIPSSVSPLVFCRNSYLRRMLN